MNAVMAEVVTSVEEAARLLAVAAHGDALNRHDGEPYIRHVIRVVEHLRSLGANEIVLAVAWLHDVVEDTEVTLEQIRDRFGDEIAAAVDAISHRPHESRIDYYQRLGRNLTALIVKMSDGRDNQDPDRKALLEEDTRARLQRKYEVQNYHLFPWIIHHLKEAR